MSRPLLICDCDEVLLHMVRHFGAWLGEAHDVDFALDGEDFANAMTRRSDGASLDRAEMFRLLGGFFTTQMDRQTVVPGAIDALARIGAVADIVILTNLEDCHHAGRVAQLAAHGIRHRVVCNQGPKGPRVAALVAAAGGPITAFVDDLPRHHRSVAREAPGVHRLHMVAERALAIPPAPDAHARIDDWPAASDWLLARFDTGAPATGLTGAGYAAEVAS